MNKFFIYISLFFYTIAFSQSNQNKAEIKMLTKYVDNSVLIRWAPTNPSSWLKLNKWGYRIERIKIASNGERLSKPVKKVLVSNLIPDPLEDWEKISKASDYAAILAQALYGEGFLVSENDSDKSDALLKIINQSREIEQRFAFGLFAADIDFEASQKAALGYVDSNIEKNSEYLYRVISNIPENISEVKKGFSIVKTDKVIKLPKPLDLVTVPQDKSIILTWEHGLFRDLFVAYFVERSEDGENFEPLNSRPLVNLNDTFEKPVVRMQFVDTLSHNNKKYYYRVKGITSFGEDSPYSEIKSGTGYRKLTEYAKITGHKFLKNGKVNIKWVFEENKESPIVKFQLNQSNSITGKFHVILDEIPKDKREISVKLTESTNYITVSAISKQKEKTISQASLVQAIDSIPPGIPKGLEAIIDTSGVVKIKWNRNLEKDLIGYRVFRGNLEKEEFIQLTVSPIKENYFVDNVKIKSLNDKVFYKIVSVDNRFNMSDYSDVLIVKKPDVIPPSSPIFKTYKITQEGIHLFWIPSSSGDVIAHKLYRKNITSKDEEWQLLFEDLSVYNQSNYLDKSVKSSVKYIYGVFAEDDSGLISKASTPLTLIAANKSDDKTLIKNFKGVSNRTSRAIELSWNTFDSVEEIQIYKSTESQKATLFKQFSVNETGFIDVNVKPNNTYTYTIKAKDNKGNVVFEKVKIIY